MPKKDTENLTPDVWTLLTDEDVSGPIMAQNRGGYPIEVQATVGDVAPVDNGGTVELMPGQAIDRPLDEVFYGVPGANRLWAYSMMGGRVSVQHG